MHSFIKLSVVYQFDLLSDFHLTLPQEVVISVLMKLAGGCPSLADQLNVDAFLEQARSYDKASSSPIGWYIRWAAAHADNIKWVIIYQLTYWCIIYSWCPEMLKQGNFHILCLFYVLVRLMNGQEVKIIHPFSNVPCRSIPYRKFSITQRMKFKF